MTLPVGSMSVRDEDRLAAGRSITVSELTRAMVLLPEGLPRPPLRGRLLRPLVSLAGFGGASSEGDHRSFWSAALAVQMVHEASLIHDDIIDHAQFRRGEASLVSRAGVAAALVAGDHLLTAAYRCAALAEIPGLMQQFTRAVERTVWGERRQCELRGDSVCLRDALEIASLKTGELFSVAAGLGAQVGRSDPAAAMQLGRQLGRFYQMLDDFLDYCAGTPRGKEALSDYRGGFHTWVTSVAEIPSFDMDVEELHSFLFSVGYRRSGTSQMGLALQRLSFEADSLLATLARTWPQDRIAASLVRSWLRSARTAYCQEREVAANALGSVAAALPDPAA